MTCLHLHPKGLRIPDWERQQDIVVVVCLDCGKVLEIRLLGSHSGKAPSRAEALAVTPAKIVY
jgi:hypothetical protein